MSAGDVFTLPGLHVETFHTSLRERLLDPRSAPRSGEVMLYWLGQAGFVIEFDRFRLLIDPYLSDSLAEKYQGTKFPQARFAVPAAIVDEAVKRCGVGIDRLIAMNAGERMEILDGCFVSPIASAHETLDRDSNGNYPWLGYVIDAGGVRLYHSGDCIPYPGLEEAVAAHAPHVTLLPVNGRDAQRSDNGVPGNFRLTKRWRWRATVALKQ